MPFDSIPEQNALTENTMLAAIVDTAGSVILGLHPDHRIFAWNRAAEQLYQTERAKAIGMDYVATFIAPEHRDAVAADIQQVLAGKRTLNFEDDSILPDGSRRTLIWNVTRVSERGTDSEERVFGVVATGQDITERKEAEERFRLIFEHTVDGLLLADDTGVIDCNPAAVRMLGLRDKSELLGRRPAEFSPLWQPDGSRSDEKARGLGAKTLEQGELAFSWVHQRPDGTDVPVDVNVRHAMFNGKRVSVVSWSDQTRRQEFERERAALDARLHLAQKMEAVGQLAGGIAHDFNNLLTAIQNSVQLAQDDASKSSSSREDLSVALDAIERAARLTRQLLAFTNQPLREMERIDFNALVRDMVPLLQRTIPAGISLVTNTSPESAGITADRDQLEQVIMNLLENAQDAMPEGGTLTLTVTVDAERQTVALRVSDEGLGMDDATRARIFEPFFTTKAVGGGPGLGLAMVYGVVTQAGGAVWADSAVGSGTTITVEFPLRAGDATDGAHLPKSDAGTTATVLLVDDDDLVRSTTRRLLQRLKYRVIDAQSGFDALQILRSGPERVDIVLTDIRMPGMDGVQFAREIRNTYSTVLPVVFFSGFDEIAPQQLAGLSTVPLVTKPFSAERLQSALTLALAAAR